MLQVRVEWLRSVRVISTRHLPRAGKVGVVAAAPTIATLGTRAWFGELELGNGIPWGA